MITIFDFQDFRDFIRAYLAALPKRGYGQSRKHSVYLGVHTTLISQILKGQKAFTLEQAVQTCDFLSLSEIETDYFLLLVQWDRAGSVPLKKNLQRQMKALHQQSRDLSKRLVAKAKFSDEEKAVFYSDWLYSALRQLCAIEGFQSVEALANHVKISKKKVKEVMQFLVRVGMCKGSDGHLTVGPTSTHLESDSPWISMHHLNWRQKTVESLHDEFHSQLHYTAPMTLSLSDAEKIREMIAQFLESIDRVVEPSPSEILCCLNIDWFRVVR